MHLVEVDKTYTTRLVFYFILGHEVGIVPPWESNNEHLASINKFWSILFWNVCMWTKELLNIQQKQRGVKLSVITTLHSLMTSEIRMI